MSLCLSAGARDRGGAGRGCREDFRGSGAGWSRISSPSSAGGMMITTVGKRWVGVVLFAVFESLFVCWKLVVIFIVSSIPNCFDDPDLHWSET